MEVKNCFVLFWGGVYNNLVTATAWAAQATWKKTVFHHMTWNNPPVEGLQLISKETKKNNERNKRNTSCSLILHFHKILECAWELILNSIKYIHIVWKKNKKKNDTYFNAEWICFPQLTFSSRDTHVHRLSRATQVIKFGTLLLHTSLLLMQEKKWQPGYFLTISPRVPSVIPLVAFTSAWSDMARGIPVDPGENR